MHSGFPGRSNGGSTSRMAGLAFMIGVFSIGAVAGLGIAWWLTQPIGTRSVPGAEAAVVAAAKAKAQRASPTQNAAAAARDGIDPGELPYDGKPPSFEKESRPTPAMTADAASPDRAPIQDSVKKAAPRETAPTLSASLPSLPAKDDAAAAAADSGSASSKPPAQAKAGERHAAKASPRHRSAQKVAKDQEIERIKQQAAEELVKKKTENRRLNKEAKAKAKARLAESSSEQRRETASTHAMLARCERMPNIIRREICKWEVCSGMWGKNGCPSYDKPTNLL